MTDLPRIKIISDGLARGEHTRIMSPDEHGNWVNISSAITEIDIHMRVGELNTAEIKSILVGTEIDAVVTAMQTKVLPPSAPKPQFRFTIDQWGVWTLKRIVPLPTYGVKDELLAEGKSSFRGVGVGPLTIVQDVEE